MFTILFVLLVCLVALYLLLGPIERKLVYWPDISEYVPANGASQLALLNIDYRVLELEAHDGVKLVASELLRQDKDVKKWLIHFHGNASNHRAYIDVLVDVMREIDINVLITEYRGFYKSEGVPNEADINKDARLYYDYLIEKGVESKDIILYGYSLGTGVAVDLAAQVEIAALVLEAPYTSLTDVAKSAYGDWLPTWLMRNRFETIKKIDLIDAPLFVMHGSLDEVIPYGQGVQVFEAGLEPKQFFSFTGGHEGSPETLTETKKFLEKQRILE